MKRENLKPSFKLRWLNGSLIEDQHPVLWSSYCHSEDRGWCPVSDVTSTVYV